MDNQMYKHGKSETHWSNLTKILKWKGPRVCSYMCAYDCACDTAQNGSKNVSFNLLANCVQTQILPLDGKAGQVFWQLGPLQQTTRQNYGQQVFEIPMLNDIQQSWTQSDRYYAKQSRLNLQTVQYNISLQYTTPHLLHIAHVDRQIWTAKGRRL